VDPDDAVARDRLSQTALLAVGLAFDFGRAAALLSSAPNSGDAGPDAGSPHGELGDAADRMAERVSQLQSQVDGLNQRINGAAAQERPVLLAQRGEVAAALDLARQVQATVTQIQRFEESTDARGSGGKSGLAAQIDDLLRTVPEARHVGQLKPQGANGSWDDTSGPVSDPAHAATSASGSSVSDTGQGAAAPASTSTPPTARTTPAAASPRPESAGVFTLVGEWFSLQGTHRQLTGAIKRTNDVMKELESIHGLLSKEARALARQDFASGASADATQLVQIRKQLEAAATRFKQLSTLLVPLGEQEIALESARNTLSDWRVSVASRATTVTRYLALRLSVLIGSVIVVLSISEIWRRATFRYLHDARRRRQFLVLRRVAVGIALTLVIVFGLVSEVGSVATYAGFVTAGLAVALQNVILAVVAYFFLIGRYGVRVGDRITLAGVTGRVVDIGLVRIYLMELAGSDLHSTGRMVVLSNAVLFQPSALFKQIPGADYFWHTIVLTLAPTTDVQSAQSRLTETAQTVYDGYRKVIEQQHATVDRFLEFETSIPQPEINLYLTESGVQANVRYPVEQAQGASIDQKMLASMREALAKPPSLELVSGPTLKITPE
jgi:small-conductance mechanosensitive channel